MLCFRDMTFCSSDCVNSECSRHYGEDDEDAAWKWARSCGFDHVPVNFADLRDRECCQGYRKPEKQ